LRIFEPQRTQRGCAATKQCGVLRNEVGGGAAR
jgi:hypothetical protein